MKYKVIKFKYTNEFALANEIEIKCPENMEFVSLTWRNGIGYIGVYKEKV